MVSELKDFGFVEQEIKHRFFGSFVNKIRLGNNGQGSRAININPFGVSENLCG
jgi:hypothetical protein